jgi:hypothetical protein
MAAPGHCHLNDVRRKSGEAMPPGCGEAARRGVFAVAPYRRSHSRGVSEWPIIDEVNAACTSTPVTGTHPSLYGVKTEPGVFGLRERNHAVLFAEVVVEHV